MKKSDGEKGTRIAKPPLSLPQIEGFSELSQYGSLLEKSEDIIFIFDLDGTFHLLSSRVEKLTGYKSEELAGKSIYNFVTEESAEKIRRQIENWVEEKENAGSVDIEVINKNGLIINLEYFSWPIYIDGKLTYIQGIARDVTRQKLFERIRYHITKIYGTLDDLDSVFERIQDAIGEILKPQVSLICLYDQQNDHCVVRSIRGKDVGEGFEPIVEAGKCPIHRRLPKPPIKNWGHFFIVDANKNIQCPNCRPTGEKGQIMGILLRTRQNEINYFICLRFEKGFTPPEGTEDSLRSFSIQAGSAIELAKLLFLQNIESRLLNQFYVGRDLNNYLDSVIDLICNEIGIEACSIFVKDREGILRLRATTGIVGDPPNDNVFYFKDEGGMTVKAARTGNVLVTSFSAAKDEFLNKYEEKTSRGVKRWIGVPIKNSRGLTLGVLRCVNRKVERELLDAIFFPHDIELLEHLALIIAVFIELSTSTEHISNKLKRIRHEILNPIVGIRGNISYVLKHLDDASFTGHHLSLKLKDILEESELLRLHASSIISGSDEDMTLELQLTNLYGDIIRKCTNMTKTVIREHGYSTSRIECSDSLKRLPPIWIDRLRFEEVVYNILINAIKYAKDSKSFRMQITGNVIGRNCIIKFSDYGIGISEDETESIFIEGYRSKDATARVMGMGIGLTIARRTVEAHDGNIFVSKCHDPTEISIVIPYAIKDEGKGGRGK